LIWLTLGGSLSLTLAGGAAIGASLGLTGLLIIQLYLHGTIQIAAQVTWNVLTSFALSAVPMFVLLGEILVESGLSQRIYGSIAPLFERIPGKLLHTNIAVCTLFGAVSGSSTATAAAVGSVSYPELCRRGYDKRAVVASLAAGGTLGLLIPPSLSLLIYGAWQEVSIGRLFLAGILPGLMMAALFMAYIFVDGLRRPALTPDADSPPTLRTILTGLVHIWPLAVVVFATLGTIYRGFATVTEAAGLGVFAATVMGFLFGELSISGLWRASLRAVGTLGILFFVVIGAVVLGQSISALGLPRHIVEAAGSLDLSAWQLVVFVVVVYVALGCLFDGISLMLLTLPFIFPLMTSYGFDPVWLGVFITVMIEIGMITPPVGVNLYVLAAITRNELTLPEIAISTIPFWILMLGGTVLLVLFPEIALFLPSLMD
jgi:tripartite ATP-independent transporter DctM subunit